MNQQSLIDEALVVDQAVAAPLQSAAAWAKVLGIIGMMVSVGLVLTGTMLSISELSGRRPNPGGAAALFSVYVIAGALLGWMAWQLLQFSSLAKKALRQKDQQALSKCFKSLAGAIRLCVISSILSIVLGIAAVIGFVVVATYSRM